MMAVYDEENIGVSRETLDLLKRYERLVIAWSKTINLVSSRDLDQLWQRHIVDSIQICRTAPEHGSWIDLGSGGGFPGVVASILNRKVDRPITLVESDGRKAAFLNTVGRDLALPMIVVNRRISDVPSLGYNVISARALAPLSDLIEMSQHISLLDTTYLFPKGRRADLEIEVARQKWVFDLERIPSRTDPEATILKLTEVHRAN